MTHLPPTAEASVPHGSRKVVDTAQYALAGFLGLVGAYVVYDATTLDPGFADQPVEPSTFPYVVGGVLILLAVLFAVATARGDVAEAEDGEDVEIADGSDWRTVGLLGLLLLANLILIDFLGWAITGALLFAGAARILGSHSLIRDLAIGTALSLGTWYGFYVGLNIPIPAGILDGVL